MLMPAAAALPAAAWAAKVTFTVPAGKQAALLVTDTGTTSELSSIWNSNGTVVSTPAQTY